MKQCPRCGWTADTEHKKRGAKLQKLRTRKKLTLREVSQHMGKSISYVSDLEHGRRRWTDALEKAYREAVGCNTLSGGT